MINRDGKSAINNSIQELGNDSFDRDFNVNAIEALVFNELTGNLDRMSQPGNTLPTSGNNPAIVLVYTGSLVTSIQKTIGATTYTKSLTYNGSSQLTNVSSWS
jgi:hypothetical protein